MTPRTAHAFITLMEHIWEGGPLWDRWHDAVLVAKACGMQRTGGARHGGEDCNVYRFPGADDGVWINPQGSALGEAQRRRRS